MRATWTLGLLAVLAIAAMGCGASTLRVTAAPTMDDKARIGFESTLSLGIGWPMDFKGRSHHYVQARGSVGGGYDRQLEKGVFLSGGEIDYIYWGENVLDVRGGLHFGLRKLLEAPAYPESNTFGFHLAALPILWSDGSSWIVPQIALGPELRAEYVWDGEHPSRGIVSLPLVLEGNLLAAGD